MFKFMLPLLLLLPLLGCAAFGEFAETTKAIQAETTTQLEEVDEKYTAGEITAEERDLIIKEVLLESKARLDAAARTAGDSILGTGNEILDMLIVLLFGGTAGGGLVALKRRIV